MKILILAIVVLAGIIGSAFFFGGNSYTASLENPSTSDSIASISGEKVWIEVLKEKVFEFDDKGKLIKELKTGDTLEEGRIVDAGTGALANIYFPDGSILKLDSETKIQIQKSEFQKTSGKLSVKIILTLGRVWSQVKSLAGNDSEWQIETPNAVAAVRGTGFGVEFTKGKSMILVLENKVLVSAKDTATNNIIASSETIVSEKEFVSVDEKDLPKIKTEKRTLKIEKADSDFLNRAWIKRALEEQKKETEIRKIEEANKNKETEEAQKENIKIETPKIETGTRINTNNGETLKIINRAPLEKVFEGESIKFEAILILNSGSEKNVTNEVLWQVLGGIGRIEKDGTFLPKLDQSVSEFGSAFGNIIGIWKDKTSGKEILGKTPIFKVEGAIIEENIENSLEPRG
ncbi:MAG TPA: FecR family protein [Candidatus Paceibacterota bacterium]